ncbi:MAG: metal-sensitive transcriptional regulator [Candidatus Atribacteria bacterium]|nr:metal-sensitive transcriptional regulator [Candidatus Atribacteria bacterium]
MSKSQFNQLNKIKILSRLKRIEGQIRGIQGMIIEERSCSDIMVQIAAVKSALNQVSKLTLENHVNSCFYSLVSSEDIPPDIITEVMELILKFIR